MIPFIYHLLGKVKALNLYLSWLDTLIVKIKKNILICISLVRAD